MRKQELRKKYLLAINIKRIYDSGQKEEYQIFEFISKEDRDSVIDEISDRPDVTWATSEIVLH
jgi:hypothetical protein